MRGFRQFSAYLTKCHACHGICTLSPLDAALSMQFAKKTRNTTRLKCCACHAKWRWTRPQCCACHENFNSSCENDAKVLHLPHKELSTRYKTRLNVTKCHACHAKRIYATLETCKSDPCCGTYHRHGHAALMRTVANGCGRLRRLRTVADGCGRKRNVERTHPQTPDPQSETGTLATHSGKTSKN